MNGTSWVDPATILLGEYGSRAHGTGSEDSDTDLIGICVEPREYLLGLNQFEQLRTQTAEPGARSGRGDVDRTVYSLRKWARLAVAGNPSILFALFLPDYDTLTAAGSLLLGYRDVFLSKAMAGRFLGYMNAQRAVLTGERGKRVQRPELVSRFLFDTKFAYHMLKLGIQGTQVLAEGRMTIPFADDDRQLLLDVRHGKYTLEETLELADTIEAQLKAAAAASPLTERPDMVAVNRLLIRLHEMHWALR